MIRSSLRTLYSKVHYFLNQIPNLEAYVQNRVKLANFDLEGVIVKIANPQDFDQIAETVDKFRDGTRIAERTGRGDLCVVAYKHGKIAHVRWAALSPLPSWGDYTVHLAPDEAYTYDGYTVPAFRRQGISSEARTFLITYLMQQGIRCTYSDIRVDNIHTQPMRIKRVREGRSRLLGVITVTTRLGWTRCTFTADTESTRSLIARLLHVPLQSVRIRSIKSSNNNS